MIVVDASAVLAILLEEPDQFTMETAIQAATPAVMSPVNLWEVLARAQSIAGGNGATTAEALVAALGIEIPPRTSGDARAAAEAFARFGRRTPAGLNLGDCFAYALSKTRSAPLLFKGDDFTKTDVARL